MRRLDPKSPPPPSTQTASPSVTHNLKKCTPRILCRRVPIERCSMATRTQGKCLEYADRAEALKKALDGNKGSAAKAGGGGGKDDDDDDDDDDDEAAPPLTEQQLKQAERDMEEELSQLIGMDSVKRSMRDLCKQLSLDIRRRQEGRGKSLTTPLCPYVGAHLSHMPSMYHPHITHT